jgi:hypothetical protein
VFVYTRRKPDMEGKEFEYDGKWHRIERYADGEIEAMAVASRCGGNRCKFYFFEETKETEEAIL